MSPHRFTSTVAGPVDRGHEFGAVHADRVAATLAAYRALFATVGAPDLDTLGGLALTRIAEFAPTLADEIRGIAAGAGVSVTDIAAINARTEILAQLTRVGPAECSTVVALDPTGSGAGPVAMQNWDWYAGMADNWLEWTIPFPDGRQVTTVTEFGLVGKIGINERGVGTLFNILHHDTDGVGLGVPVHAVARRILDSAGSVAEALAICAAARVSASTAITVVDAGSAVSVELWPGGVGQALPDATGRLVRTNHFLTTPARAGDTVPSSGSDTLARYAALTGGAGDPESVGAALSDHADGVCCHAEVDLARGYPWAEARATLAHVRLDIAARRLHVTAGPPCGEG